MHTRQYTKQMEKRSMIGEHTLVVGLDIGSEFNAACFMDKEGNVLGRYPKVYNSRKGFEYFRTMVDKVKRRHKLTQVFIGMEPTGHYWRKIAFFAKEQGPRYGSPPQSSIKGSWMRVPRQKAISETPSRSGISSGKGNT